MFTIDKIDNAKSKLKQLEKQVADHIAPAASTEDRNKGHARYFVDLLMNELGVVVDDIGVGKHLVFTGQLKNDFSKHIDKVLSGEDQLLDGIRTILPTWKRDCRFDMKLVQKMFDAADTNMKIDIQRTNAKLSTGSNRTNHYIVHVVVK